MPPYDYPLFRASHAFAKPEVELIAVSSSRSTELTYGSDLELETAYLVYVSGWMFDAFGLRPALGRLFTEDDDRIPQGHPYAVLSHDYWQSRFAADPEVIGQTFRLDERLYEIVGVVQPGFSGTEPGTMTDIFVPSMMNLSVESPGVRWFKTLALIEGDIDVQSPLARLQVPFASYLQDAEKDLREAGLTEPQVEERLNQQLRLEPASAGASGMQRYYRQPLVVLSILVSLVLLIACANVANLMTARSLSRAREMALRVAIGAGRRRLVQLVLVESALISVAAALIAGVFAWWATPLIVGNLPTSGPVRLALPFDWRLFQFGLGLTLAVTITCGLAPALGASAVRPVTALKGGGDPHTRRPLMSGLIGAQVAFFAVVLFFAGLFVATLDRLANQPLGYSVERLLAVETVAAQPRTAVTWSQVADRLRALPGIEAVSLAGRPLMGGGARLTYISVDNAPPTEQMAFAESVSPGWIDTMKIPLLGGRDLRADEVQPVGALVNVEFAKAYFNGENPVGKSFKRLVGRGEFRGVEVVGLVGDAKGFKMREPTAPAYYIPFDSMNAGGDLSRSSQASFIVRTTTEDPLTLADAIQRAVPEAHSEFSVSNITTQQELNASQTVRERLLASLALFFAAVALILSAVGVYGVLHYSVVQQRREIGIRIALGAQSANVALRVTKAMFAPVLIGSCLGLAIGVGLEPYVADLLWNVEGTDPAMIAVPALAILAALLAAVPEVMRAVRVDPAELLRTD
jgi:predicted permease